MSGLRIIAGLARGRKLVPVPGDSTRPITDRTKESLFNIIGTDILNSNFLDLFAGTGSVGIEALSRGASYARFLDINNLAVKTVRSNLEITGFTEKADVMRRDAFQLLRSDPDRQFDYVYVAPPQYKGIWIQALKEIDANKSWLGDDAWVIVQVHPREYSTITLNHLVEFDQRKYGSTLLIFYQQRADVDE